MQDVTKKFLVIGTLQSTKNSKYYITGRMWSIEKKAWLGSKRNDGTWGDQLIEVEVMQYNKLKEKIETCTALVVDAVVSGYNDFNFPIWSIKL